MPKLYNCLSITVRPREGIPLGSDSFEDLLRFLRDTPHHIIGLEKEGTPGQHLQCGIITEQRIDNVKRSIKRLFPNWTPAEQSHALCVKNHKDWQVLVNYCAKEKVLFFQSSTAILPTKTPEQLLWAQRYKWATPSTLFRHFWGREVDSPMPIYKPHKTGCPCCIRLAYSSMINDPDFKDGIIEFI